MSKLYHYYDRYNTIFRGARYNKQLYSTASFLVGFFRFLGLVQSESFLLKVTTVWKFFDNYWQLFFKWSGNCRILARRLPAMPLYRKRKISQMYFCSLNYWRERETFKALSTSCIFILSSVSNLVINLSSLSTVLNCPQSM